MKCDRRWYNDGRLERDIERADGERKRPDLERWGRECIDQTFGAGAARSLDVEVVEHASGHRHVIASPRGHVFRISLPKEPA